MTMAEIRRGEEAQIVEREREESEWMTNGEDLRFQSLLSKHNII